VVGLTLRAVTISNEAFQVAPSRSRTTCLSYQPLLRIQAETVYSGLGTGAMQVEANAESGKDTGATY